MLTGGATDVTPPSGIVEVLKSLVFQLVDNPVNAIINANYIGILTWAISVSYTHLIVNSVNGEEKSLAEILPIVKKYGAAVVGLTLDEMCIRDRN